MHLLSWLNGARRRFSRRGVIRTVLRGRSPLRLRRDAAPSPIAAYVEVCEERLMLSSVPVGVETRVNSTTTGEQGFSAQTDRSFALTPDGGALVAWTSDTHGANGQFGQRIVARRIDAQGNPVGAEIQVSAGVCESARNASVAGADLDRRIIVWESTGDPLDRSGSGIFARFYDTNGAPLGNEFRINQTTAGDQKDPSIVGVTSTSFVVTWSGNGSGNTPSVYARIFSTSGVPLTNEFRVPSSAGGGQHEAIVRSLSPTQGFIVAWSGPGTGDSTGIFARTFNPAGSPIGNEYLVNTSTAGTQTQPTMAFLVNDQGFVVAWQSRGGSFDHSGDGVVARRLASDGTPQGSDFLVNDTTYGDQKDPSVAGLADGGFVVAWSGSGSGDWDGVFVREFDTNGTPRGASQLANTTRTGTQAYPTVRTWGPGYLVVWSGRGVGDSSGVFLQRFAPLVASSAVNALLANATQSAIGQSSDLPVDWTVFGSRRLRGSGSRAR